MEQTCYYLNKLEILSRDIINLIDEFSHIDPNRLIFCLKNSPKSADNDYYAEVKCLSNTNLDFTSDGRVTKHYYSNLILKNGLPALYLIDFTVPSFIDLDLREKICTIMHELYHISPLFNGELRLFKSNKYLHGPYPDKYDEYMYYLCDKFLQKNKNIDELFKLNYKDLINIHGELITKTIKQSRKSIYRLIWV